MDANVPIHYLKWNPLFSPVCKRVFEARRVGKLTVISSELTLMETTVQPIRDADPAIAAYYELWEEPGTALIPISREILERAAELRAAYPKLRTPDAIHAAIVLVADAALFVTGDAAFP